MKRELPAGWQTVTLGDVVQPSKERVEPGDYLGSPYLSLEHLAAGKRRIVGCGTGADASSTKTRFRAGDVLYGRLRPYLNKVVIPDFDGICSTDILVFPQGMAVDNRFLLYYLSQQSVVEFVTRNANGINLPRISFAKLSELEIDLPPLAEQRRIAGRASELYVHVQSAVDTLECTLPLFERLQEGVLRRAFRGELTAAWRQQQRTVVSVEEMLAQTLPPTQPSGGRAATHRVIPGIGGVSVGIPKSTLPNGWKWTPLQRIARQETGHTPSRQEPTYWGGSVPWIGIRDAAEHHGGIIHDTQQHVTDSGLANSSARLLPAGTVCLSRTASVGYVVVLGRAMATSQDFATWTCTEVLDPEYLMYALLSEGDHLRHFGKGTTHTTIYFPEIRAFHIALAPLAEQQEIVRRVRAALAVIHEAQTNTQAQVERLTLLDQRILARAMQGLLVQQNPRDEPASALLNRMRAMPKATSGLPIKAPAGGRRLTNRRPVRTVQELADRLLEVGASATPESLLLAAGLSDNVDGFYELLRDARNQQILSVPTGVAGPIRRMPDADH